MSKGFQVGRVWRLREELVHGTADTVVPYRQSLMMQARANETGLPNQLITVPGGKHVPMQQLLSSHMGQLTPFMAKAMDLSDMECPKKTASEATARPDSVAAPAPPATAAPASASVYLTVAYCPSVFSGEGAVVKVDPHTGNFEVVKKYAMPADMIGCPMNSDPNFFTDASKQTTYLSFSSDWGLLSSIELTNKRAKPSVVKAKSKDGSIFDGFTNFALSQKDGGRSLKGLTPHVTESGFCSDGCFGIN